jgi:hypothetical protein
MSEKIRDTSRPLVAPCRKSSFPSFAQGQTVVGTIDVESDRLDAFTDEDQKMLEQCAISGLPLWGDASQAGARSRR